MNTRVLLIGARRHLETAVKHRPDHARYLELLGEACLVCGDSLAAIPHLERVLSRDHSARATWLLAWAYVHAGRLADVERLVRELIEEGRGCARALYIRALARFKRRAFDLAVDDLREAMPDEADVPFFRRELARALIGAALQSSPSASLAARTGQPASRVQMLREAITLLKAGDIDDVQSAPERSYLLGCALLELGESTRALSVLAETDYPAHAEASFRRGIAAANEGDILTARTCLEEARKSGELEAPADICLAALADSANLDSIAIPAPAIAPVGLGPLSAPVLIPLVIRGEGWPASPWAGATRPPPDHDEPASEPADLVFDDPEERLAALRAALTEKRFDPDAIAACVAVLEAERLEPDLKRRILAALAVALQIDLKRPMEEVEQIMPLLMRLRRAAPGLAFAQLYVGRYYFRLRDYARADQEIAGIQGGHARRPVDLNVLGRCYEKLGRLEDAEQAFRRSLKQKPVQPTISFSLGRLLLASYRSSCVEAS
jgi:tetratricopeptide (TPR) repeat protein